MCWDRNRSNIQPFIGQKNCKLTPTKLWGFLIFQVLLSIAFSWGPIGALCDTILVTKCNLKMCLFIGFPAPFKIKYYPTTPYFIFLPFVRHLSKSFEIPNMHNFVPPNLSCLLAFSSLWNHVNTWPFMVIFSVPSFHVKYVVYKWSTPRHNQIKSSLLCPEMYYSLKFNFF